MFGVVGLGYVGLPLAVEMAKSGHRVVGMEISAERGGRHQRRAQLHPRRAHRRARRPRRQRACSRRPATSRRRRRVRRRRHLRPDAAQRDEGARHLLHGVGGPVDRPAPAARRARHARVDDLPRHHRGDRPADPRDAAVCRSATDLYLAFSPERVDPGQPGLPDAQHAEGRRRRHAAGAPRRPSPSTGASSTRSSRSPRPAPPR